MILFMVIRYVGLSSTGITFKSGSAASFSSSNFQKSDRYGGFGSSKDGETFKDSFKEREKSGEDRFEPGKYKPRTPGSASASNSKKGSSRHGRYHLYSCLKKYTYLLKNVQCCIFYS